VTGRRAPDDTAPKRADVSDEELVARARDGDRAAFDALVVRHHGRVFSMCARLVARSDVDDAVQTTFLQAWRSLHRFEGKSRFTTWLTRIAIHTSLSARRRLVRWLLPDTNVTDEDGPALRLVDAEQPRADDVARQRAIAAALDVIVAGLSPKKRTVFVLSDLEGYTSPEVGEVLEIPEATVRTRLFYARREVKAAMADHPVLRELLGGRDD